MLDLASTHADIAGRNRVVTSHPNVNVRYLHTRPNEVCNLLQAYKNRGEKYQLFWNDRAEFVRMAARFGATIVPFAGVGCEDGVNMLLGPDEIRRIPILGDYVVRSVRNSVPQARRCGACCIN